MSAPSFPSAHSDLTVAVTKPTFWAKATYALALGVGGFWLLGRLGRPAADAKAPPILLASGTTDPIVRVENSHALAAKLRAQGSWVTEKYYDGFGHIEPVVALGSLMRFRMPMLRDMVDFFQTFGAFPSGTPRPFFTPEPPETEMTALMKRMDQVLQPIETGGR